MRLGIERREIVRYGNRMVASGLTSGTGGNLSVRNIEEDMVAVSPSGIPYDLVTPEQVAVVNFQGERVEGEEKPSSEFRFHLSIYEKRRDVRAVVHTHSPYATTMACLHWEIPAVHYMVGVAGKRVPVAPYATFGTEELAENLVDTLASYNAVLLANHGLVAVGPELPTAFAVAEEIEFVARIYHQTRCVGLPPIIPETEMERVLEKFKSYGPNRKKTT
ncbi:MAG: L-fuculose-phosphate aldolase [Desulfococcaceae bacterium]